MAQQLATSPAVPGSAQVALLGVRGVHDCLGVCDVVNGCYAPCTNTPGKPVTTALATAAPPAGERLHQLTPTMPRWAIAWFQLARYMRRQVAGYFAAAPEVNKLTVFTKGVLAGPWALAGRLVEVRCKNRLYQRGLGSCFEGERGLTVHNAQLFMDHPDHWGQAVGGAGGSRHNVVCG